MPDFRVQTHQGNRFTVSGVWEDLAHVFKLALVRNILHLTASAKTPLQSKDKLNGLTVEAPALKDVTVDTHSSGCSNPTNSRGCVIL